MKISIVFDSGDLRGTQREFQGDTVVRFGRHEDNDIVFTDDTAKTVSGFHAEIHIVGRIITIVDSNSTNGVLVNGQWAERTALSTGDNIELGKDGPSFKIMMEAQPTDPPPKLPGDEDTGSVEQQLVSVPPVHESSKNPISENPFRPYANSRENTLFPHPPKPGDPLSNAPPDKKYGERTVGVMIKQALSKAGGGDSKGTSKSTEYFEALVDKRVKTTSSRLKKIVVLSVVFALLIASALGFYFYKYRSVEVYQTTHAYGDAGGQSIASANRFAIYMLAGRENVPGNPPGKLQGFCTAFAVTRDVLATNAHCVSLAKEKFTGLVAIMNGAPQNTFYVTGTVMHGGYVHGRISPDVGLVRINGQLPNLVSIAPYAELGQIAPGATMFLYGFPGRLNREDAPEATFIKGDIGRVTTFEQKLGDFGTNTLLQHSAFSTGGTSGSPIFNASGHVIGINAGGYVENGKALAGYNFAMRIDLINELLPVIRGAN